MPHKTMGWSICMKNSMNIHKIAGVLCALQSVTNLGAKCNQTPPLKGSVLQGKFIALVVARHELCFGLNC